VRLGYDVPRKVERIAPVALFHSSPPAATSYRFVFVPSDASHLEFRLYSDRNKLLTGPEIFDPTIMKRPETFYWTAASAASGWCRLEVTGWALRNNAPLESVVHFYHWRRDGR
jgi:hypothetical protein